MPLWLLFAIGACLFWGAYVPTIHAGQIAIGGKFKALWAFLFVGVAYFLTAVLVPAAILAMNKSEVGGLPNTRGIGVSTLAGVFGAAGALCVILALLNGGTPAAVPPIVFAGAPIVASLVAMLMHPPKGSINPMYFVGIVLAAAGAAMVLRFKPSS